MDAYSRFQRCIFQWNRSLLQFVGQDIIAKEYKPNLITFFVYGLTLSSYISEIYTFLYYEGYIKILSIFWFLFGTQGLMRIYNARHAEDFHWAICFIQDLYKINGKTKSRERKEYFDKFAYFTEFFFKAMTITFALVGVVFLLSPFYYYYIEGKLLPSVPLYFPGFDETTLIGFVLLNVYQLSLDLVASVGFASLEFLSAILIISSLIFAKLISSDLEQINIDLREVGSRIKVKSRLINVFLMHQEMDEYMQRIDKISFLTIFAEISTSFCGAIVCFYAILTTHYMPIYGSFILLLNQIFIACLLGNCVELAHSRIYDSAIHLNWDEFDIRDQCFYRFFIRRCQTPRLLTIGGIIPLNLNSCVKIFGRIYSVTMMIYHTVEGT